MQVCQWRQPWPFFFIILQQRFSAAHHRITEMTTDEPHAPLSDSCSRRTQPGKNRGLHPRCYAAIETQHTVNDGHTSSFPGSTGLPIPVHPSSPPLRPFPPFCTVMPKAWVSLTFVKTIATSLTMPFTLHSAVPPFHVSPNCIPPFCPEVGAHFANVSLKHG